MIFQKQEIKGLNQRYRANLINCVSGFKSLNLVGTISSSGETNLAVMSQIFHLGADPALMGLIVRPSSVPRHSYENILDTGYYTFNHVNKNIVMQAHQTSARYDRNDSEFKMTGLQEEYMHDFPVPFVKESNIKIGLKLEEEIRIAMNETILLIGSIEVLFVPEVCLQEDGFIDLHEAGTITSSGLDAYFTTSKLMRLSYAKTDKPIEKIHF